ncbi:MAG: DNA N-6-adenine-methyltransferase [Nitrososphaeraceae archaeon]|nr:DNA N-6-adenine-methyltransferase [Nitrososphaeraceae archaeon]
MEKVMFSHKKDEYITPKYLFDELNFYYNFYTDPCTTKDNPLGCKLFFTKETDGLNFKKWVGNVFINPSYGKDVERWVSQALTYCVFNKDKTVVMLLPARTDTRWFQQLLDMKNTKFHFISGRLQFRNTEYKAPFPSVLVFFNDFIHEDRLVITL